MLLPSFYDISKTKVHYLELNTLHEELTQFVFDLDNELPLRRMVLGYLVRHKEELPASERFLAIVAAPEMFRADTQMVGSATRIVWPQHLSTMELFANLPTLRMADYVAGGSFDELLRFDIPERLLLDELPIALDWIAGQQEKDHELSLSTTDFIREVMERAWQHLEDDAIRLSFASAVWTRLQHYSDIFPQRGISKSDSELVRDHRQESHQDDAKRHLLVVHQQGRQR